MNENEVKMNENEVKMNENEVNECTFYEREQILTMESQLEKINLGNKLGNPEIGILMAVFSDNIDKISEEYKHLAELKNLGGGKIKKYGGAGDIDENELEKKMVYSENNIARYIVDIDNKIKEAQIYAKSSNNFFKVFDSPKIANNYSIKELQDVIDSIPRSVFAGLNPADTFCDNDTLNEYIKNKIKEAIEISLKYGLKIVYDISDFTICMLLLNPLFIVLGSLNMVRVGLTLSMGITIGIIEIITLPIRDKLGVKFYERMWITLDKFWDIHKPVCGGVSAVYKKIKEAYENSIEAYKKSIEDYKQRKLLVRSPIDEYGISKPDTEPLPYNVNVNTETKKPSIFKRMFGFGGKKTKKNKKIKRKTRKNKQNKRTKKTSKK